MRRLPKNVRRSQAELARIGPRLAPRAAGTGIGVTPTPPPTVVSTRRTRNGRASERGDLGAAAPRRSLLRRMAPWLGALAVAFFAVTLVVVRSIALARRSAPLMAERASGLSGTLLPLAREVVAGLAAATNPPPEIDPALTVRHEGHASIPGGVLFIPDSFATTDGSYDLLLHLHGNTAVVRESVEVSGLNAAVAVINLGVGSAPYEAAYAEPGTYERLLESIDRAMVRRGIEAPKLRRVALSSWSAGYGAISTILQVRRGRERLDAILLMDGLHCGWDASGALNRLQMAPFVAAARAAAAGQLLFAITHSEIDPQTYASSAATASYLLEQVKGRRMSSDERLPHLDLDSVVGAVARDREKRMETISDGRKGELHVRGYQGELPEHHMAHLFQMGATVLPELAERWAPAQSSASRPVAVRGAEPVRNR